MDTSWAGGTTAAGGEQVNMNDAGKETYNNQF